MSEHANQIIPAARRPPLLLAEVWRDYLHEHCARKGQDLRRVIYTARPWLRIFGPDAEPALWKRRDIQEYEDIRKREGLSACSIRREMCLQQAALNHAKKWERIPTVVHFEKPSGDGKKRRPLAQEEFDRLMKSPLSHRLRMFFLVAYWTGHRSRAIETLTWDRVDLEKRTINFTEPGARRTNKRRVDGFPIPDELLPRLVAAKDRRDRLHPNDPYVIGLGPRGKCSTTYHIAREALEAIGINEPGVARHCLRKTFATIRIHAGFSAEEVGPLIGDNPTTLRKHYLEWQTEQLRGAVNMTRAA